MKSYIILAAVSAGLSIASACSKAGADVQSGYGDRIVFSAESASLLDMEIVTRASEVNASTLNGSGFKVTAVTASGSNYSTQWSNSLFTRNGSVFEGGYTWPSSDPGYKFYASNVNMTVAGSGTAVTVAATNATDIVCAYMPSPSYKGVNTLAFKHIFARLGDVTFSAISGYTVTGISVYITPKTEGTFNITAGIDATDGTGWSSVTTGSAVNVADATPGTTKHNDIYLVPGEYTISATWTATKDSYTRTYTSMEKTVNLVAGKVNAITADLRGEADDIAFNVSVTDWVVAGTNDMGTLEGERYYSFGGFQIASGPLVYEEGEYVIKEDWNISSYNSVYGKNNGSTYFSFIDMGKLFEKTNFSTSDGSIENLLDPLDGWRLPTSDEWYIFYGSSYGSFKRNGSTVNGTPKVYCSVIELTDVYHAGTEPTRGILFFPDNQTITGKAVNYDGYTLTSGVTIDELNTYLEQGCVFFPASGARTASGNFMFRGINGEYILSDEKNSSENYYASFSNYGCSRTDTYKQNNYLSVRLIKPID